jgi:hypothetical protein
MGRLMGLFVALAAAGFDSPAVAGQDLAAAAICYGCGDDTIFGLTNLIAYLEANPDVDEAYKGPIITAAREKILLLRASLPPQPMSPVPCCYTRKPIYIR